MKILYAASEAAPFCKTGGLADVAGSLPEALAAEGNEVAVILPLYQTVRDRFEKELQFLCFDYVDLAWRHAYCGLFCLKKGGVTWYFLDNEQYFGRPNLYGYLDDGERFGFFSRAVVRMLPHLSFRPQVIHCNDWQTALIPIYLKDDGVREDLCRGIRTVMTVHNIEYQGRYGLETLGDLFGLDHGWADDGTILMDGDVNLLKAALLCADAVTAVSPSYAEELKFSYFASGLESVMRRVSYKLSGVLNGIDETRYDPAADPDLTAHYSKDAPEGKEEDKAALRRVMGLRPEINTPIIGMVSRMVSHKGLDLVCEVFHDLMELPVQLVVLGKGDSKYEDFFRWAQQQYPGRMAVRLDQSESLAMSIYAGADLFLMPSRSEPCGLAQMIAMRYGTVPIVRETGGLKDTVRPYEAWRDAGNGFTFAAYNSGDMLFVLRQAVTLYREQPEAFRRLQQRAMSADFSWKRSAGEYRKLYETVTGTPHVRPEPGASLSTGPEASAQPQIAAAPASASASRLAPQKPLTGKEPKVPAAGEEEPVPSEHMEPEASSVPAVPAFSETPKAVKPASRSGAVRKKTPAAAAAARSRKGEKPDQPVRKKSAPTPSGEKSR